MRAVINGGCLWCKWFVKRRFAWLGLLLLLLSGTADLTAIGNVKQWVRHDFAQSILIARSTPCLARSALSHVAEYNFLGHGLECVALSREQLLVHKRA